MKNLRNLLKKFTVVTLLAALLITSPVTNSFWGFTDSSLIPLGDSSVIDYTEF